MTTPPTPYRNEIETLEARKRVLETELESIQERIKERRRLPLLDQVKVATPCPAKWDEMVGDDRKRFCLSCDKNVFNISALSREEAEAFLQENARGDVCVRYYQRADGTIMTSDCSVGVSRKRRKKIALAVGAGAMALGAATAFFQRRESRREVMGAIAPVAVTNPPPDGQWVGGAMTVPLPTTQPPTTVEPPKPVEPPPHVRQGRMQIRR